MMLTLDERRLVLPMAGESRRFLRQGFDRPKWALEIAGVSMLERSLQTALSLAEPSQIVLVALTSHQRWIEPIIRRIPKGITLDYLGEARNGQALSVFAHTNTANPKSELIVWNCDSWIRPGSIQTTIWGKNALVCAKLTGDAWSFARVIDGLRVVQTAEKQRISDWCSLGMYSFSSVQDFNRLVGGVATNDHEVYIAPLYNEVIRRGQSVWMSPIEAQDCSVYGTPQDLEPYLEAGSWDLMNEMR